MDEFRRFLSDCKWLDNLAPNIASEIESFICSLQTKADEWKDKFEVHRCSCEQQYFELEKQLITANTQLEAQNESLKDIEGKYEELEKKHKESSTKLKELHNEHEECLTLKIRLSKSNEQLEDEKKELAILLEKRSTEVDRLNGEYKELSEKFSEANRTKSEALAKVEEFHSRDIVAKYQNERFSEEIKQLKGQVEYLNGELEKKITDQQNIVKDKTAQFLKVQSQLDTKTDEAILLKESIESLKKVNNEQRKKIEEFNQKLKDTRDDQIKAEFQFQQELQSQTKLVNLYKGLSEESETKIKELSRAVSELQNLLKEASEGQSRLEAMKDLEKNKYLQQLEIKEKKIKNMENELRNANDLISKSKLGGTELSAESIASLSPTAAATSKLLKSGMTLTQIYNEYVQAIDELQLEKEENKRLKSYLDQIMQEIEEKAPILRQQREDYEQALHTITQLTHKLDTAMLEGQKLRNETEETRRRMTYSQREIKRLTQQVTDLGQQVQFLLREVEELRGGPIGSSEEVSSTEVTSSSQLISERLVTFKSVKELQVQNQRLLEVVRKLSDERETEEQVATDAKSQELKQSLDNAMEELEEVKSSRTRQEELVESIIRQRDMYRVLYQESTPVSNIQAATPTRGHGRGNYRARGKFHQTSQSMPSTPFNPFSPNKDKELQDMKMALQELQTEYATYKREKGENDKILYSQLEKLRGEISDMRVQNTKLASQLDFATERYKVLQNNSECYRKEINILKEQNKKCSTQCVELEKNVSILHSDLVTAQSSVSRLQVRCQNLTSERDLLKAAEQRLVQEKENMLKEQHSQNVLLSNLQTIQNNMERVENETKSRLQHQVDVREKELTNLRRKLDNTETEYKGTIKTLQTKISNLQRQQEQEVQSHQKSKDTIIEMTRQANSQKQELAATQAKLACAETKLSKSYGSMDVSSNTTSFQLNIDGESLAVKDLRSSLNDLQTEIKGLKEQLEKSRKHVDQYKAISESLENSLKDQNRASENFNQNSEKKLETLKEANESKDKTIERLEKEKQYLSEDNTKLSEEKHKMIADLRKQLSNLQNELQEAIQSRKTAIANEQAAREGCDNQVKLAAEAQDKYQRELILHAADLEALSVLKKNSVEFTKKLETAKKEAEQNLKTLNEAKTSWVEQERIMKSEFSQIEGRNNDLGHQNNILHEQLAQLSTQVAHIQKSAESSSLLNTSLEEKEKSSEQLLEVIRFLRKEKEISVARVEVAEAEALRMKQRLESVQKQYEETCKNLSEEREHSQVTVHTAAQHAELMHKVENLNVFTESNAMLRQEKDRLEQQVKELTFKVKKFEEDIEPLQLNLRELTYQKDNLMSEKSNLTGEVERWKARTNRLIEQCNKSDPEEHRKIVQEREDLKKQMMVLNEENMKKKAELSRLNSNTMRELNSIRTEIGKKDTEIESLRTDIEEMVRDNGIKEKDLEDKAKTISQLKKIGRKYKEQAEDTAKQLSELRDMQLSSSNADASKPDQLTADTNEIMEQLKKKTEEVERKQKELEEIKASSQEQINKLEQQLNELKESENQLKTKNQEMETNQNKFKNLLQSAKTRITSQKEQLEKMAADMNEQKKLLENQDKAKTESVMRENSIKSQYESRISNLERELEEARRAVNAAPAAGDLKQIQKENAELQAKVQQIQKQLEVKQKQQPSSSRTTTPAASADRLSLPVGEAPKMANIRPMTSTTPAPVRQTAVQHASAAAAAKATASIKPMAIASTTASPVSATTPTATVMPTTITTQEPHDGVTDSPPSAINQLSSTSVPLTNRPVQQIQRVTPQIELMQDSSLSVTPTSVAPIQQVDVEYSPALVMASTSTVTSTPGSVVLVSSSSSTSTNSSLSVTSNSSSQEGESNDIQQTTVSAGNGQSQSQHPQASTSQSAIKRTREDVEVQEDNSQVKRPKTSQESSLDLDSGQTIQVVELEDDIRDEDDDVDIHDDDVTVEEDNGDSEVDDVIDDGFASSLELTQSYATSAAVSFANTLELTQSYAAAVDDDVVIVDDDDDDDDDDNDDDDNGDDGGNDGDQQIDSPNDDPQQTPTQEQSTSCQVTSSPGTVSVGQHSSSQLPSIGSHTERLTPSAGSGGRSQLIPFMFQGPPGPFEEGDDCTVPSTPTLFVPRRGDGFAEALSYPQVPQRFVFGPEGASHSELESQGALGMDDTRMDLSQFDDGQVRSLAFASHQVPTSVFSNLSSTPPQQLLQGDNTNKEQPVAKEGTSSASSTDTPKEDQATEEMASRTVRDGQAVSSSGEQVLPPASEDDGGSGSTDPQGLRKSKIQPIVWDQSSGQGQQHPAPAAPLLQNPTSSSTLSTPSTSAGLSSARGRGGDFVWTSNLTPSPSTIPSPTPTVTTPRGGGAYNTRGVRCATNTRGRGAIMRGHPTRSPIARGHIGRARGPASRTPGARGRSLRRKN